MVKLGGFLKVFISFVAIFLFTISCGNRVNNNSRDGVAETVHNYRGIFGESYLATGIFQSQEAGDSIEDKHWLFTNLTRPFVMYGDYSSGFPAGNWNFGFKDSSLISSTWSIYKNELTNCSFSLPFPAKETVVDSFFFKLTADNDSLGKISIIVGITNVKLVGEALANFGPTSERGLLEQGYTFTKIPREIQNKQAKYYFTEYFLKDSTNRAMKLYHIYGYGPSNRLVEFSLAHDGPKEDWVKSIYNVMVASLYVNGCRFYNPYLN